jgi:hypothetical protein
MHLSDAEDLELRVCSAILTGNRDEALKLLSCEGIDLIHPDLLAELRQLSADPHQSWLSAVVRASYLLPAWVQFVGQRAVLASPRLAHWVLRKTRIHHRWY